MLNENEHHRKETGNITLTVVPADDSRRTRSFSFSMLGLSLVGLFSLMLIGTLGILLLIYTPIGSVLPVGHPELERKHAEKLLGIQEQLNSLMREMAVLQDYNLRLRRAMGEQIAWPDSTLTPDRGIGTPAVVKEEWNTKSSALSRSAAHISAPTEGISSDAGPFPAAATSIPRSFSTGEFPLSMPSSGYVTREMETDKGHFGIDIAAREGAPVVAAADGNVVFADWSYDFGFMMIIAHGRGYATVYKHNQSLLKTVGSSVKRGELIALLGNTGRTSSGPHVHFELWKDGIAQNPTDYMLNIQ